MLMRTLISHQHISDLPYNFKGEKGDKGTRGLVGFPGYHGTPGRNQTMKTHFMSASILFHSSTIPAYL